MKPYGMITKLLVVALMLMGTFMAPQSLYAQCVPPPSGMVAWWPLDETSGPTAHDLAGVDNAGTWMNNPTPVSGKVAGALCFDGNDYVEVGNDPEINFGVGDLTIDAWVKRNTASTPSPPSVIIDKRDGSDIGYCLAVSYGHLVFRMPGTNYITTASLVPADGLWHFVAVTVHRATGGGRFYCDGIPRDTFTPLSSSLNNANPLRIGKGYLTGNQPWLGCIDELELFNRALDSLEVRSIWAADSLGKCKDTCHADGDANHDGVGLTSADFAYLSAFINACGSAPVPLYSCDLNGDGYVNSADLVLYHLYFILGRSVFDPYGGYPVRCPCDPIAAPVPDTVNIFGLEHTSLDWASLTVVEDTLKVTRLNPDGEDGIRVDLKNQYTSWNCSMEAVTDSVGMGASLQMTTNAIIGGVTNQPIGTMRETIMGANETKLSVDYETETYTVVVCNDCEEVLYQEGIEAQHLLDGPTLLWPQQRCCWPFCSKIERIQRRWYEPHRHCPGWKKSGDLPPGFSSIIELDGTSGPAILNWAALGEYNIPFTRIEIIPEDLTDSIDRLSSVVVSVQGIDSLSIISESAGLYYDGIPVANLGNAILTPVDTTLVVSNIGSTGDDGVAIDLGEAQRFDAEWEDINPDSLSSDTAGLSITTYGQIDGIPEQLLGNCLIERADSGYNVSFDYSPLGSSSYTLRFLKGDSLICTIIDYSESWFWCQQCCVDGHIDIVPDCFDENGHPCRTWTLTWRGRDTWIQFPVSKGDSIITGVDKVEIIPEDVALYPDHFSKVEFRATNIPYLVFTNIAVESSCCQGMRGNVNDDPDDMVDISDVVYLINYLFKGGAVPPCMEEANANGDPDNLVNVGDVVYLINYLFKGGPSPILCSGKSGGDLSSASRLSDTQGHAQISLVLNQADQTTTNVPALSKTSPEPKDKVFQISVVGKSDRDVAGVQMEIGFDPGEVTMLDPVLTPLTKDLQLYTSIKDGVQKIGIVDLTGEKYIPKGEWNLAILMVKGNDLSSIKIKKAILVDKDAMPLALKLSGELKQEEATGEMVKVSESKPTSFSLSQNYPNPFNPETDISYSLPADCQVKLTIYNVAGQNVRTLVNEHQTAGFKTVHWNGKDNEGKEVASGVYFYKIQAGAFTESRKMILMK